MVEAGGDGGGWSVEGPVAPTSGALAVAGEESAEATSGADRRCAESMEGVIWCGCRGFRMSSADSIMVAMLRCWGFVGGEAAGLVSTWVSMAAISGVGAGCGVVCRGTGSSGVNDLAGGMPDTCGGNGVTLSAGG